MHKKYAKTVTLPALSTSSSLGCFASVQAGEKACQKGRVVNELPLHGPLRKIEKEQARRNGTREDSKPFVSVFTACIGQGTLNEAIQVGCRILWGRKYHFQEMGICTLQTPWCRDLSYFISTVQCHAH